MNRSKQLEKLVNLADLILDSRLSELQAAARAKQACETQLAGTLSTTTVQSDLHGVAAELANLNYQRWADKRRAELNQELARRTVAWIGARDAAREAFGRKQALVGITTKHLSSLPRSSD